MVNIGRVGAVAVTMVAVALPTFPAAAHDDPAPAPTTSTPTTSTPSTSVIPSPAGPTGTGSDDPRANPDRFSVAAGTSLTLSEVLVNDMVGTGEQWDEATLTVTFPGRDVGNGMLVTTVDDAGQDLPGTYWVCTTSGRCVTAPVMVTVAGDHHGTHWPTTVALVTVALAAGVAAAAGVGVVAHRRRRNVDVADDVTS